MTTPPGVRRPLARWFWAGFFTVLGLGVIIALFAAIRGGKEWATAQIQETKVLSAPVTEVVRITLAGGETFYIDNQSADRVIGETRNWLSAQRGYAKKPLEQTIDEQTEVILQAAVEQVPVFADWYYSLTGEYARLFNAATGNLAEYMVEQLDALVFSPAGTAVAIDGLATHLDDQLALQLKSTALQLVDTLSRLVREARLDDPLNVQIEVTGEWSLGTQIKDHLVPLVTLTPTDMARQGVAVSTGAGLAVATAKKLGALSVAKASAKIVTSESAGLLAAAASKAGVKALAGAGTGAASGAALCTGSVVGAPLAPGCALFGGIVTGVATWLLVDKAVIEAQELLNRDKLEADLREALFGYRDELRETLRSRYLPTLDQGMEQLSQAVNTQLRPQTPPSPGNSGFIPSEAVRETTKP